MRMGAAATGSALFLVLAPGTVAGAIPWTITGWTVSSPGWPQMVAIPLAAVLIGFGLIVLLDSFSRFALQGMGTPTPLLPTNQLIVTGLYRHVRNPMYVAVLSLIGGQALLFGSPWLVVYGTVVWTIFHISVVVYEEPRLRADYGDAFDAFCWHVPRWLPRIKPWQEGKD